MSGRCDRIASKRQESRSTDPTKKHLPYTVKDIEGDGEGRRVTVTLTSDTTT